MSGDNTNPSLNNNNKMSNWAEENDSSDEEVEAEEELHHHGEEEESEEEDEDDEEMEIMDVDLKFNSSSLSSSSLVNEKGKESSSSANVKNLSKKEKEALRKKELEELDSIFNEFGLKPSPVTEHEEKKTEKKTEEKLEKGEKSKEGSPLVEGEKKKKKKKPSSTPKTDQVEVEVAPQSSSNSVVVDVKDVLKNKLLAKKNKNGSGANEAVKEALKALAESDNSKRKKKESLTAKKKNYSEFS